MMKHDPDVVDHITQFILDEVSEVDWPTAWRSARAALEAIATAPGWSDEVVPPAKVLPTATVWRRMHRLVGPWQEVGGDD